MTEALLGIDVGTTAVKAAAFDPNGRLLGTASVEYPTRYPRPGWVEQDPEEWWRAAGGAIRGALERAGRPRVPAGCGSAPAPTPPPLQRRGRPPRPAPAWEDR